MTCWVQTASSSTLRTLFLQLKRILPYCFEMHGKCHYVDENLHEVSIPYEEIIPVVAASDYDGFIVTEYEDEGGYDAIEQTTRHVAMVKKLLNQ